MLYCSPNVSFTTIWYRGAFSLCFVDTLTGIILAALMASFGTAELLMYKRHGSRVDSTWLKPVPFLYRIQVAANIALIICPFVWLGLRYWVEYEVYGYTIVYNVLEFYVWSMSLTLLLLERNFDLPTPPSAGHSILLNCFWGFALALESLYFVNFNGDQWYFVLHSAKDRVLLSVFVVRWLCAFLLFVFGMLAPGMVTIEQRGQFTYSELADTSTKYGSTSTVESNSTSDFAASVDKLRKQLASGELSIAFRSAYRQKHGQTVEAALNRENSSKNRYSNVLPYDFNRVLLKIDSTSKKASSKSNGSSDYVNASWIVVRMPKTNAETRYIATQGPMQTTVDDFWRMIWEHRVHTVVMLTELVEMELPKCYKYWPEGENCDSEQYGSLLVSCIRVSVSNRHVVREFSLIHVETQAELNVVQIQFKGWPDHGVPKKTQMFVDFLDVVHSFAPEEHHREASSILIHCSAGIGRTGVYLMAETLMKHVDAGVPLKPFELMMQLRDQRMGMVQTEQQFLFICELALKYADKRPSPKRVTAN